MRTRSEQQSDGDATRLRSGAAVEAEEQPVLLVSARYGLVWTFGRELMVQEIACKQGEQQQATATIKMRAIKPSYEWSAS